MDKLSKLQLDEKLFVVNGDIVSMMSVYDIISNNMHKNNGLKFYTIKHSAKHFKLGEVLKNGMCASRPPFCHANDEYFKEILKSEEYKDLAILINDLKFKYYKLFIESEVYIDEEFKK